MHTAEGGVTSDLEGLARRLLEQRISGEGLHARMVQEILDFKDVGQKEASQLASAVVEEVRTSASALRDSAPEVLRPIICGVTMGSQGVGCRGTGDFFVHRLVAELSETGQGAILAPQDMDDAGAMETGLGSYLVAKMEGMHSRLSDFPFLAGFHVARAALRDVYVKGAVPKGLLVDVHLADDADVGKLLDFTAGVACVSELSGCPILGGSTLRIGGDMVIGTRMTGGVSVVGTAGRLFPRRNVRRGDAIIMTEGAGGGTICTTAIYSGRPQLVAETLNLRFLTAARALIDGRNAESIHCLSDVTNGGIRADLHEIGKEAGCGAIANEEQIVPLVNPLVKRLLDDNEVDYLGVSLDSLLVFCDKRAAASVIDELSSVGVRANLIGRTTADKAIRLVRKGGVVELLPRFRESAYTPIKKVVESGRKPRPAVMERRLRSAARRARLKKAAVVEAIRKRELTFGSGVQCARADRAGCP